MELYGVFAYTIYGDKIRVTHYSDWDTTIGTWYTLDDMRDCLDDWKIVKFFAVRSWDDPEWNTSRYRSIVSLRTANEGEI